ncbi:MAG TPA: hypothetical protein VKQ32_15365 [Polyangia bacterium]|nr:hypothetical protein [Polyangia bacterium]
MRKACRPVADARGPCARPPSISAVPGPADLASRVLLPPNMDYQTLEGFRRKLLGRRISLLERRQRALAAEDALLAEREPDWEDAAAAQSAATVLDGVGEAERGALIRIQSALARIERGTYDECGRCHGAISEDRLRAVSDTELCERCAASMT